MASTDLQLNDSRNVGVTLGMDVLAAITAAPVALFGYDETGRITQVAGGAGAKFFPLGVGAVGHNVTTLFGDSVWLLEACRAALDGRITRTSGHIRGGWYDLQLTPQYDARKALIGVVGLAFDVTQRRMAEEKLLRSEEKLRVLLDQLPGVLWSADENLKISLSVGAGLPHLGLVADQLVGMTLQQYVGTDDPTHPALAASLGALQGQKAIYELHFHNRDFQTSVEPLVDSTGAIHGILGFSHDITDRKAIEHQLEATVASLRATLESTADGIVSIDSNFKLAFYNKKFLELWRMPESALFALDGRRVFEFIENQVKSTIDLRGNLATYLQLDQSVLDVVELRDGRIFEHYSQPQRMGNEIVGRVWSFRDVTQRRQAESMLLQRTQELRTVLDHMVDSVFACDAHQRVFLINRAGKTLAGLDPNKEVQDLSLSELVRMLEIENTEGTRVVASATPFAAALRGQTAQDAEVVVKDHGHQRKAHLRLNASPIRDDQGRVIAAVCVGLDVTEKTELDHLRDQFVKVAAHELKTPIAVMKANAQLALMQHADMPPRLTKLLNAVVRGADRIDRIVRNLLDVSQLLVVGMRFEREPVDFSAIVRETVARIPVETTKHTLRVVATDPVWIVADRERVSQVVNALVDNAVRYSPKGGVITVQLRRSGTEALLTVEDPGIGIPAEQQGRVFERFFRAHSGTVHDYGGMGVALHIAREIMSRHGGKIDFESKENEGSRFYVTVPLASERAAK